MHGWAPSPPAGAGWRVSQYRMLSGLPQLVWLRPISPVLEMVRTTLSEVTETDPDNLPLNATIAPLNGARRVTIVRLLRSEHCVPIPVDAIGIDGQRLFELVMLVEHLVGVHTACGLIRDAAA